MTVEKHEVTVAIAKELFNAIQDVRFFAKSKLFDAHLREFGKEIDWDAVDQMEAECALVLSKSSVDLATPMAAVSVFDTRFVKPIKPDLGA